MSGTFHTKYRPRKLARILGQEAIVQRLQGIVTSGKYPSAILFAGPTSAGKTTLARAFAREVNEVEGDIRRHPDYLEIDGATSRGIDEVRSTIDICRLSPQRGRKRFIVIDEAQQLTPQALQALLKTLEEPPPDTIIILCTMEPEKFNQGYAKAVAGRCSKFILQAPSQASLATYISRIAKAEELTFLTKDVIGKLSEKVSTFRDAASITEAAAQYMASNPKGKFSEEALGEVMQSTESKDDEVAVRILLGVYLGRFGMVQKALLDAEDPYALINKLLWLNTFMLNDTVLKGQRHPKVWTTKWNMELKAALREIQGDKKEAPSIGLSTFAATQEALVELRTRAQSFLVPETNLIGAILYRLIAALKGASNAN